MKYLLTFLSISVTALLFSAALSGATISVTTAFSCTSNADCKAKCEALGSDHTWKRDKSGATHGTCTKRRSSTFPSKEGRLMLNQSSKHSESIKKEINRLFAMSPLIKRLGLNGLKINGLEMVLDKRGLNERVCASCLGPGIAVEMCCRRNNPNCFDVCASGEPIVLAW